MRTSQHRRVDPAPGPGGKVLAPPQNVGVALAVLRLQAAIGNRAVGRLAETASWRTLGRAPKTPAEEHLERIQKKLNRSTEVLKDLTRTAQDVIDKNLGGSRAGHEPWRTQRPPRRGGPLGPPGSPRARPTLTPPGGAYRVRKVDDVLRDLRAIGGTNAPAARRWVRALEAARAEQRRLNGQLAAAQRAVASRRLPAPKPPPRLPGTPSGGPGTPPGPGGGLDPTPPKAPDKPTSTTPNLKPGSPATPPNHSPPTSGRWGSIGRSASGHLLSFLLDYFVVARLRARYDEQRLKDKWATLEPQIRAAAEAAAGEAERLMAKFNGKQAIYLNVHMNRIEEFSQSVDLDDWQPRTFWDLRFIKVVPSVHNLNMELRGGGFEQHGLNTYFDNYFVYSIVLFDPAVQEENAELVPIDAGPRKRTPIRTSRDRTPIASGGSEGRVPVRSGGGPGINR